MKRGGHLPGSPGPARGQAGAETRGCRFQDGVEGTGAVHGRLLAKAKVGPLLSPIVGNSAGKR